MFGRHKIGWFVDNVSETMCPIEHVESRTTKTALPPQQINKMNEFRVLQSNEKQIIVTYWNVQNGHIQLNITSIFMTERETNIRRSDLSCKIIEHSQFQHSNLQILFYFHVQHQNVKINFKIIVIIWHCTQKFCIIPIIFSYGKFQFRGKSEARGSVSRVLESVSPYQK